MVDLTTNLSLVDSLIRTSGVQDGEIKLKWALKRINNNKISKIEVCRSKHMVVYTFSLHTPKVFL